MPKLDLFLYQGIPPEEVVEVARLADENGFQNLWLIDSQNGYTDVWTSAALCAANTSRIRIGPGVTNPLTRHPEVTANAALSIHEMSGGRSILGLGSGDSAVHKLGWKPATVDAVRACVELCRDRFEKSGADIPIYVAADGPKMTAAAAKVADGIIAYFRTPSHSGPVDVLRYQAERVRDAAEAANRDIKTLPIVLFYMTALSADRREALEDARGWVSRVVMTMIGDTLEWPPESAHLEADARRVAEAYNYKEHLKSQVPHAELVTDALVEALAMAGKPEDVMPKFEACWEEAVRLEKSGVDVTLMITPPGGRGLKRSSELFVKEILPRLR